MGKGTKVVAHEGMGTGTGIFSKYGYGDGHYSTLPIGYPLPSLIRFQIGPLSFEFVSVRSFKFLTDKSTLA